MIEQNLSVAELEHMRPEMEGDLVRARGKYATGAVRIDVLQRAQRGLSDLDSRITHQRTVEANEEKSAARLLAKADATDNEYLQVLADLEAMEVGSEAVRKQAFEAYCQCVEAVRAVEAEQVVIDELHQRAVRLADKVSQSRRQGSPPPTKGDVALEVRVAMHKRCDATDSRMAMPLTPMRRPWQMLDDNVRDERVEKRLEALP